MTRVLGQINRSRAAKQRIHAFLRREAALSEAAARVVARILERQSATMEIEYRAASIQTLTQIARQWPAVSLGSLRVREVEVRRAV